MGDNIYEPIYAQSRAVIVGINDYHHATPLGYAQQDAVGVAEVLKGKFAFPEENIKILLDADATRAAILESFLNLTEETIQQNDRVLFFFAGHGYTQAGRRGEVGYLVPVDGDTSKLATLIRWDELTRNADLIPAKHILFIMDACYGGLAVTRSLPAGSSRFLKDMLSRFSRQVLTAGKADEVVADSGGPRRGHSMFTGHFLDALDGRVATADGIISANSVMAYVYECVAKDPHSRQTPHFGFLEGDGDFIFSAPPLEALKSEDGSDDDVLLPGPAGGPKPKQTETAEQLRATVKECLSEPRYRIRLQDLVAVEMRAAIATISDDQLPPHGSAGPQELVTRMRTYEAGISRALDTAILLGKWSTPEYEPALEMMVSRMPDGFRADQGLVVWLGLRYYPLMLILYGAGIAAIAASNWGALARALTTPVHNPIFVGRSREVHSPAIAAAVDGISKAGDIFKMLPGYERKYVPLNEYLFKYLQPSLEDALFLGTAYEEVFDRFEVFYCLIYADFHRHHGHLAWGPIGRFGWKQARDYERSPFDSVVEEAEAQGSEWGPVKAGLFGGSIENFKATVDAVRKNIFDNLHWI